MDNDMKEELLRRRKAAWLAYGFLKETTDQLSDPDLRAHLFDVDVSVLPALCYATETWADTAYTSKSLRTTHRAHERCLLKFSRLSQHRAGLYSSDLRTMSRLRDPAEYKSKMKHRWVGHIMRSMDVAGKKNTGVDSKRVQASSRKPSNEMFRCVRRKHRKAAFVAKF